MEIMAGIIFYKKQMAQQILKDSIYLQELIHLVEIQDKIMFILMKGMILFILKVEMIML